MNWSAVAAIGSLIGVVVTIVSVAYMSGQFTQQIKDGKAKEKEHDERFDKHDAKFDQVASKLEDHGEKIGRLQEWKNGFNAAARVSGSKEVS